MRFLLLLSLLVAINFLCLDGRAFGAQTISLNSLLDEMINRDALARLPSPAYTCRQFSSYDRDSKNPDDRSTWFANWDRSQFVRTEKTNGRDEHVMMDADGPGAIVRFWCTWDGPGGGKFSNGMLRIYFDGRDKPAIEGPIADIVDGGKLTGPPLSEGVSPKTEYEHRGHNLYLPLPYAKHCRVTYSTDAEIDQGAKKGEALYYQINYRTYEPPTEVESFSISELKSAKATIDSVQKALREGRAEDNPDWKSEEWHGTIETGGSQRLVELNGPAAVRALRFKVSAADRPQALRSTVLEIKCDGERTVWAPLGDFFGTGYQSHPYRTWYTAVAADGELSCSWVMPFEKSMEVTLHNVGKQPVHVEIAEARVGKWKWDDRSMHFHSAWHQYAAQDTGGRVGENREMGGTHARDLNFVSVDGKGVYVGDSLTVFNGAAQWWGEGDEKVYVDDERFPSHFGTGSEDYYGYAWCRPEFFQSAFHAQPEGGGNLAGGYSVNDRFRSLDAIPFLKSLRFDMELWHWAKTTIDYAPTTFFYARPGATANVEPDPKEAARRVTMKREDIVEIYRVPDALEGEDLKVAKATGGKVIVQEVSQFAWSGDRQAWWVDGKVGDELTLEIPVKHAGKYEIIANLTKANDYAIVGISVNRKPVDGHFDRFNPTVANDEMKLGTFDLASGVNRITFRIEGANPLALKKHFVGIDYLKLTPAQ
ncbi:MAG TPA: glycoside hydrolase family 172 protein [Lacipirellulaceae bacterium]|nr:glycoside hydrolase family 172 protein [Lacipirellulaceae bacterium]